MSNAVFTDWPSGSANTGWPQEPTGMLMPGRVQGWPAGTQRAANAAERLLSQAVAWWDVEQYRDGDRFLRNRGTAGELLDLRLGSALAPNSNEPQYLAPDPSGGYVYLPGVDSNGLRIPTETALNITGDIDARMLVAMDDWTPAATVVLFSKWQGSTQQSWWLQVETNGFLRLQWSTTGADSLSASSGAAVPAGDGQAIWVRATLDVDNGASGNSVQFFTSADGTTWTQLGSTITTAGVTSIFASTVDVNIGGYFGNHAAAVPAAKVYRAQMLNGINGTTVLDVDCDAITSGATTSFTAVTGQTVTISKGTSGRKAVAVPSRHKGGKPVMTLGTDDYMEVQGNWQHNLLNFTQGDSFTALVVTRDWTSTTSAPGVLGKNDGVNGWRIDRASSSTNLSCRITRNAATISRDLGVSSGTLALRLMTLNKAGNVWIAYANTDFFAYSPQSDIKALPSLANAAPFTIGRRSDSASNYADTEFYAAAVFRRVLTPAEITLLSNYFTGRIA